MKKHKVAISVIIMSLVVIMFLPAGASAVYHSKKDKDDSKKTIGIVKTKIGKLKIVKVKVTQDDFYARGYPAREVPKGHKILVVWLEKLDGKKLTDNEETKFSGQKEIYIKGDDDVRYKQNQGPAIVLDDGRMTNRLFVAFTPKKSAHKFRLYWPGNKSIYLGK